MDLLLAAIREEQVGATHGAQGRGKDLVSLDTGAGQLVAIRTEKVNTCVSVACRSEQGLLIRELHIESINHVSTHLITTTARCWSNRCDHVFRFSAVPATHLFETFQGDTSQRSTPACVNGRISSGNRIGQQNRNTICSLYACQHPARIADRRKDRSEEHTSELQSLAYLVCRLLLEKKKNKQKESGLDLPIANLEHFAPDETAHHAPARARRAVALLPLARLTVTSQGAVGEHPVQLL